MKPNQMGVKIIRIVLGVILLVFGLNHFFQFLPMPEPPEAAMKFLGALMESGFVWPLLGVIQLVSGILLIIGRYVLLALVLFAPVAVGILLYHLALDPAGGMVGYIVFILEVLLVYAYFDGYKPMLKVNVE
ncbi:MAG: DoxX family membrane protein [Bacteroidales bacterium]|nr:DoxX family membrane protein [Bacteroidales bacterium]